MKLIKIFCLCVFLLLPSISGATIMIAEGLFGGSGDVENVLFNETGLETGPALTVQGITNQSNAIVNFTGMVNLSTPAIGQARIEAADDLYFSYLEIEMEDYLGFSKIQFNINADTDAQVTLTFMDQFGDSTAGYFTLDENGENFFTAYSLDNQVIVSAVISQTEGEALPITDIKQIRLNPVNPIPEPATLLLVGSGLISFAMVRRKKIIKKA